MTTTNVDIENQPTGVATALYLLHEIFQVSSDKLLRVWTHIFTGMDIHECGPQKNVRAGDLCIFNRVDSDDKCLLGSIIKFSIYRVLKETGNIPQIMLI